MRLYGTLTSPFVRRVRVVAAELDLEYELVDASTEEGQRALRQRSPIWKVPAADLDGRLVWDSGLILDHILQSRGYGRLREPSLDERMFIAATDEAVLALVRQFYLQKDGVDVDSPSYLVKERQRVASILEWVEERLQDGRFVTGDARFGLGELALYTGLDWIRFRNTWALERHPKLLAFLAAHQERSSLVETAPPG